MENNNIVNPLDRQALLVELHKINEQLADIKANTSKTNIAFGNFVGGLFQSLGNLLGSGLLILALIYMASRFNWDKLAINYVENFMGQINWTKIIPSPTKLFSLPSLGQP